LGAIKYEPDFTELDGVIEFKGNKKILAEHLRYLKASVVVSGQKSLSIRLIR
jgi:hypothetical protein